MATPLLLRCEKCKTIFPSGFNFEPGASASLTNCTSSCPKCKTVNKIPDGEFRATFEGVLELLKSADDPLKAAKELLKEVKSSSDPSALNKWLPNSVQNLAAWIVIIEFTIRALIHLLPSNPITEIDYNTFINQYNYEINIQGDLMKPKENENPSQKI